MRLNSIRPIGALALTLTLLGLASVAAAATPDSGAGVNRLADELLAHLQETSVYVRLQTGLKITALDPISIEHEQAEAKFNSAMLARLNAVTLDTLPHEQWLLAKMLRHTFESGAHADEEWVDLSTVHHLTRILAETATLYCGSAT